MDADLKAKWTAALRSGEYKQGRGCLKNPLTTEYCCLGVLSEVMGRTPQGDVDACYNLIAKQLPTSLNLAFWHMNDSSYDGKSFAQIADYIDANL